VRRTYRFLANFVKVLANFGGTVTHFNQSGSQFEYDPNLSMFSRKCHFLFEKQAKLEHLIPGSSH
jgi:hypothetical protein